MSKVYDIGIYDEHGGKLGSGLYDLEVIQPSLGEELNKAVQEALNAHDNLATIMLDDAYHMMKMTRATYPCTVLDRIFLYVKI